MSRAPRRRRPWLIALPLALFLVVAAGWTIVWTMLRAEVERGFEAWLANESRAGRQHECPSRSIGGYPFLIELRCSAPAFQLATPQGPARLRAGAVTITALIYQPRHVLIDLGAPFRVEQGGVDLATVGFARARASFRVGDRTAERISLVLERPTVTLANAGRPDAAAELVEVHARDAAAAGASLRDVEFNLLARGLATAGVPTERGANLEGSGVVRRLPLLSAPGPQGPVADWARAGGTFELRELSLMRSTGLMRTAGTVGFTEAGRANGQLNATFADPGVLLAGLAIPGFGEASSFLGPALTLVGRRVDVEGRRAIEVLVRLDDGVLSIGAVQLAVFPPVF